MKKVIIHRLQIKSGSSKQMFQIKLPRNTKQVTSILITTNAFSSSVKVDVQNVNATLNYYKGTPLVHTVNQDIPQAVEQEAGVLNLSIPDRRDLFFSEYVKLPVQKYDEPSFFKALRTNTSFSTGTAWVDGKKEEFFSIEIDPKTTLIEGFYKNLLKEVKQGYQINIYLTLKL